MTENSNIETAHRLAERGEGSPLRPAGPSWQEWVEVGEAMALALVAIATAWSGYQASQWEGRQAELYGESQELRIDADELLTLGGQKHLQDVSSLNMWLQARIAGEDALAELMQHRFSAEYRTAFDAWLETDPLSNRSAPPGPSAMPGYANAEIARAAELNDRSSSLFAEGTMARKIGEDYVRTTVTLAAVLFLVALAQRFKGRGVRVGLLVVAGILLCYTVVWLAQSPRL